MANKPIARILYHNANGINSDRLDLEELLHSLDIDIAIFFVTKLPAGFVWRNPGYRTTNIRRPTLDFGGTAVLVRSNIQHAIVNIPMLKSLQASAISVELNGLEQS